MATTTQDIPSLTNTEYTKEHKKVESRAEGTYTKESQVQGQGTQEPEHKHNTELSLQKMHKHM